MLALLAGCGGDASRGHAGDGAADGSRSRYDGGQDGASDAAFGDGSGAPEICDGIDNDGDGRTDEGFDLLNDIAHCGSCDPCPDFAATSEGCASGACVVIGCDPGYADRNGRADDGCEYACSADCEVCDGVDNDCDAEVDEGCAGPQSCTWNGLGGSAGPGGVSQSGGAGVPAIAVDSKGAIYAAWADGPVATAQIEVFRYDETATCGATSWQRVGGGPASGGSGGHTRPAIAIGGDDLPVVAWLAANGSGDVVFVRRWNGSAWVGLGGSDAGWGVSAACGTGYTGAQDVDVAIDPVTGHPNVVWSEFVTAPNSDIFFKRFDGSAWVESGFDSAGGTTCMLSVPKGLSADDTASEKPSIEITSAGVAYVSWMNVSADLLGNDVQNVFLKRLAGSNWQAVAGSAAGAGVSADPWDPRGDVGSLIPDLALGNDLPVVSWVSASPVAAPIVGFDSYVRRFNGSAWAPLPAGSDWLGGVSDLGGNIGGKNAIATRPDGRPVLAYFGVDEGGNDPGAKNGVSLKHFDEGVWRHAGATQDGGLPVESRASEPAVAVDSWNRVVLAYWENDDVFVRRCGNTPPSLPDAVQLDAAQEPLAVGASISGNLAIFSATPQDANSDLVRLALEVRPVGEPMSGRPTQVSSLAASGSQVSFFVTLGSGDYHWRAQAIDAHGFASPWFAFGANAEDETDFVVSQAAPRWLAHGGSAVGSGISGTGHNLRSRVVLDENDRPIVVWQHQAGANPPLGGSSIYAQRWDGSAWVAMGGSATGTGISGAGIAEMPAVTADATGAPIVAWVALGNVCGNPLLEPINVLVKRWNTATSSWIEMGAGSSSGSGISGDLACGSGDAKNFLPTVALDGGGQPYVAWQHKATDSDVYVKRFDGTTWQEMGAGSAAGSGVSNSPANTYTGAPNAFADAGAGTPFLTWVQQSTSVQQGPEYAQQVYVKKFNGSAWVPVAAGSGSGEGIDANDGVATSPIGGAGTSGATQSVWIAFADTTTGVNEVFVMRSVAGAAFAGVGSASGNVSMDPDSSYWPWIAVAPDGQQAYVAWSDAGSGMRDIWVKRWSGTSWVEVGSGSFGAGDQLASSGVSGGSAPSGLPSIALGAEPVLTWTDTSRGFGSIFVRHFGTP